MSTISLTIRDDDIAELQEVTYIQLTEVIQSGTNLPGRGAIIGKLETILRWRSLRVGQCLPSV